MRRVSLDGRGVLGWGLVGLGVRVVLSRNSVGRLDNNKEHRVENTALGKKRDHGRPLN